MPRMEQRNTRHTRFGTSALCAFCLAVGGMFVAASPVAAHAQCSNLLAEHGASRTVNSGHYYYWARIAARGRNSVDFNLQRVNFPGFVGGNLPRLMRATGGKSGGDNFPYADSRTPLDASVRIVFDHASGSGPMVLITNCVEAVPSRSTSRSNSSATQ